MAINRIEDIRGEYAIQAYGKYVVFFGASLIIAHQDGTILASRSNFRNVHKITTISEDSIIVDCGSQNAYIVLSLLDGSERWRVEFPRRDVPSQRFVISPDRSAVYDRYRLKADSYLVRIDLATNILETIYLKKGLGGISDLCCDEDGVPCLLEGCYEVVAQKHISANGIRYVYLDSISPGDAYNWKEKWTFAHPTISKFFLCNTETILTNDLQVYQINSGKTDRLLLDDETAQLLTIPPSNLIISTDKKYILLKCEQMDIIVDADTRKMVARYATNSYHGCLIGNEYWVCTKEGVQRKPFPLIEPIPPKKYVFWKPGM